MRGHIASKESKGCLHDSVWKHPTCPRHFVPCFKLSFQEIAAALLHADVNVRYVSELRRVETLQDGGRFKTHGRELSMRRLTGLRSCCPCAIAWPWLRHITSKTTRTCFSASFRALNPAWKFGVSGAMSRSGRYWKVMLAASISGSSSRRSFGFGFRPPAFTLFVSMIRSTRAVWMLACRQLSLRSPFSRGCGGRARPLGFDRQEALQIRATCHQTLLGETCAVLLGGSLCESHEQGCRKVLSHLQPHRTLAK